MWDFVDDRANGLLMSAVIGNKVEVVKYLLKYEVFDPTLSNSLTSIIKLIYGKVQ